MADNNNTKVLYRRLRAALKIYSYKKYRKGGPTNMWTDIFSWGSFILDTYAKK